jgi:hypothetical protein
MAFDANYGTTCDAAEDNRGTHVDGPLRPRETRRDTGLHPRPVRDLIEVPRRRPLIRRRRDFPIAGELELVSFSELVQLEHHPIGFIPS